MGDRRDQISMDHAEIEVFLAHQRMLHVATIGPTGHPHVIATWFVVRDGAPTFWVFTESQTAVDVRRDGRVSAVASSGEAYGELKGVELRGTARVVDDPADVLEIGRQLGLKYTGPTILAADTLPVLEAQATRRVGVTIDVDVTVSWDHGKLDRTA